MIAALTTGVVFLGFSAGIVVALRRWSSRIMRETDPVEDMRSVARVRIGSVSDEALVRIAGVVEARGPLVTAPLSGRACVAYCIEVTVDRAQRDALESAPFAIIGDGGSALVLPPLVIAVLRERQRHDGTADTLSAVVSDWLARNYSGTVEADTELRVVERRVDVGDRLSVVGWARPEHSSDGATGYRDGGDTIVFADEEGAPLSVCDDESLL